MVLSAGKTYDFVINQSTEIMSHRCSNSGRKKYHTYCSHHSDQCHQHHADTCCFHVIHLYGIHIFTHGFIFCTNIGNTCLCDDGFLHLVDLFSDLLLHSSQSLCRHLRKSRQWISPFRDSHFCKSCLCFLTVGRQSRNNHHRFAEDIVEFFSVFFGDFIL